MRQAAFFQKDVDVSDSKFDVNKDVVNGELISKVESRLEERAGKMVVDEGANVGETVTVEGVDEEVA